MESTFFKIFWDQAISNDEKNAEEIIKKIQLFILNHFHDVANKYNHKNNKIIIPHSFIYFFSLKKHIQIITEKNTDDWFKKEIVVKLLYLYIKKLKIFSIHHMIKETKNICPKYFLFTFINLILLVIFQYKKIKKAEIKNDWNE